MLTGIELVIALATATPSLVQEKLVGVCGPGLVVAVIIVVLTFSAMHNYSNESLVIIIKIILNFPHLSLPLLFRRGEDRRGRVDGHKASRKNNSR